MVAAGAKLPLSKIVLISTLKPIVGYVSSERKFISMIVVSAVLMISGLIVNSLTRTMY